MHEAMKDSFRPKNGWLPYGRIFFLQVRYRMAARKPLWSTLPSGCSRIDVSRFPTHYKVR